MQTFIDFLVNNYLWFLIIALILVFALIGYLVDTSEKTNPSNSFEEDREIELPKVKEDVPLNTQVMNNFQENLSTSENNMVMPEKKQETELLEDFD